MGLTIHYSLHAEPRSEHEARQLVERLNQAARDLPFGQVGDVVELAGENIDASHVANDEDRGWLLTQAGHWLIQDDRVAHVRPRHVIAFSTSPGPGCEAANFGLCRYPTAVEADGQPVPTGLDGWNWQAFCKTQYASNPEDGGIENFLRCHLLVVKLLDQAQRLGVLGHVKDESGFWDTRDVKALAETIGEWNRGLAAFVGQFKDQFGNDVVAPITDYPDFEHLEADGRGEADQTEAS